MYRTAYRRVRYHYRVLHADLASRPPPCHRTACVPYIYTCVGGMMHACVPACLRACVPACLRACRETPLAPEVEMAMLSDEQLARSLRVRACHAQEDMPTLCVVRSLPHTLVRRAIIFIRQPPWHQAAPQHMRGCAGVWVHSPYLQCRVTL